MLDAPDALLDLDEPRVLHTDQLQDEMMAVPEGAMPELDLMMDEVPVTGGVPPLLQSLQADDGIRDSASHGSPC